MPFVPGKFSDQLRLGSSDWLVANALESRTLQGADADAARVRRSPPTKISSPSHPLEWLRPWHPHPEAGQGGVPQMEWAHSIIQAFRNSRL